MHYKYNPSQRTFASAGKSEFLSGDYDQAIFNNVGYDTMGSVPKQKNIFFVRFELHPHAQAYLDEQIRILNQTTNSAVNYDMNEISYFVKTCERPDVNFEIKTVHQYNRKRHHYTKLNYNPLNVEFYDDVNSSMILLLQLYTRYYYGDFDSSASPSWWNYDMVSNAQTFEQFSRGNWGYRFTNMGDKDETYFFKRISIVEITGTTFTAYNVYNPKIVSYTLDEKTQDTSEPNLVNIQFEYEGITNLYPDYKDPEFNLLTAINHNTNAGNLNNLSKLLFSEDSSDPARSLNNRHGFFLKESKFIPDSDPSFSESLLEAAEGGITEVFETVIDFGVEEAQEQIDSVFGSGSEEGEPSAFDDAINGISEFSVETTDSFLSFFSGSKEDGEE